MRPAGSRPSRPGRWWLGVAAFLLEPDTVALFVRPAVADLQHELRGVVSRWARLMVVARHVPGLLGILVSVPVGGPLGAAVAHPVTRALRWAAVIPLAVYATYAAQIAGMITGFAAIAALGIRPGPETSWQLKPVATAVMAAVFVTVVWWVSPSRKRLATSVALAVVTVWSGIFLVGAFTRVDQGEFNEYLAMMGSAGLLGGAAVWWMANRRPRGRVAADPAAVVGIEKEEP